MRGAHCTARTTGGRKGWRLPSIPELASLIDPSVAPPGPTLPPGHPFLTVQSAFYWSASTVAVNPASAWVVHFLNGNVIYGTVKTQPPPRLVCARGHECGGVLKHSVIGIIWSLGGAGGVCPLLRPG